MMNKQVKSISIIYVGDFYSIKYEGYRTLKAVLNDYKIKRNEVKEWWKNY